MREVHNPAGMPDQTEIEHIEEPYIRASIITRTDYIGNIMTLCLGKRGELVKQEYVSGDRVELYYDMPLAEIVIDFYDILSIFLAGRVFIIDFVQHVIDIQCRGAQYTQNNRKRYGTHRNDCFFRVAGTVIWFELFFCHSQPSFL